MHVKPFVKFVNYNHMMPTRFLMKDDLEFKNVVTDEKMANADSRKEMKKDLKAMLQDRYAKPQDAEKQQVTEFLFSKLRF